MLTKAPTYSLLLSRVCGLLIVSLLPIYWGESLKNNAKQVISSHYNEKAVIPYAWLNAGSTPELMQLESVPLVESILQIVTLPLGLEI
jgi:hypothetical protein